MSGRRRRTLPLAALMGAACWCLPSAIAAPPQRTAVTAGLVVEVGDREQAADALVAAANDAGGYFAARRDESVTLRVPAEAVESLLERATSLGVVVERTYRAEDLGLALARARSELSSREEMLESYFGVLEGARGDGVVEVEREILSLVQQIEQLRGQVRVMDHRVALATVVVGFRFQERRPPAPDGESSFPWLNTVNLPDLVAAFR